VSIAARVLLAILSYFFNADGKVRKKVGLTELACIAGCERARVPGAIRKLEARGALMVSRSRGGAGRTNESSMMAGASGCPVAGTAPALQRAGEEVPFAAAGRRRWRAITSSIQATTSASTKAMRVGVTSIGAGNTPAAIYRAMERLLRLVRASTARIAISAGFGLAMTFPARHASATSRWQIRSR